MLNFIDHLAGNWLNWRTSQAVKRSGFNIDEPELKELSVDKGCTEIVMAHSAIAYLASEATAILNEANADNYVQFDMMPRPDHGMRPIRVTVQWAHGEAPASKAARLEKELTILKAAQ